MLPERRRLVNDHAPCDHGCVRAKDRRVAAVALFGLLACRTPAAEPEATWVRWFPFARIGTFASPDGHWLVVGGVDEGSVSPRYGETAIDRWVSVIDAESGDELTRWDDLGGSRYGGLAPVAIDDARTVYALALDRSGVVPGEAPLAPLPCRLLAIGTDGGVRWSIDDALWRDGLPEGTQRCPAAVSLVDDVLIVAAGSALWGLSRDGAVLWSGALSYAPLHVARDTDGLWFSPGDGALDGDEPSAAQLDHCSARTGAIQSTTLARTRGRVSGIAVTPELLVLRRCELQSTLELTCKLVGHGRDGALRWQTPVVERSPASSGPLVVDASGVWATSTGSFTPPPDGDPEQVIEERRWMVLKHFDREGNRDLDVRRSFALSPAARIDARACESSDVLMGPIEGSGVSSALALPGGALAVSGRQGCRDAFLLRLETRR